MHKSAKAISISRKGPKPGIFDTNLINGIHMWKEEICRWKGWEVCHSKKSGHERIIRKHLSSVLQAL